MRLLIYLDKEKLLENKGRGGPHGVGYYILEEASKKNINYIEFLDCKTTNIQKFKRTFKRIIPNVFLHVYSQLKTYKHYHRFIEGYSKESDLPLADYSLIHFHITMDMFTIRKALEGYKGKVILTSHCPVPFHQEVLTESVSTLAKIVFKNTYNHLSIIDEYAFSRADCIIFPCEEAEESYLKNWDGYSKFKKTKPNAFRYIPTGIEEKHASESKAVIRHRYSIENTDFLLCFAGRHNEVKGYDILKNIAKRLFDEYEDIKVIAAGNESPLKRLNHSNWIEVGYTKDPYSIIASSDVLILPNRETYFDLVLLEALSLHKIVIASRTGGNKYFERNNVKGVLLFDTEEEAIELIKYVKNLSPEQKVSLEEANYSFFLNNLTSNIYFDNYLKLLKEFNP